MKIALLCPTRERINNVKRLTESIKNTVNNIDNVILYLGIDEDDPTKDELLRISSLHPFITCLFIPNEGTFLGLGKIWNMMVKEVPDEILAMIGDDMVFETKDWDLEILKGFESCSDEILMIHCNDGMRGTGNHYSGMVPLAVNSFIGRKYYDVLGYYTREEFKHGFHDDWIQDIYQRLNRKIYRHDIMIRHLHYSNPTHGDKADKISANLGKAFYEISNPRALYDSLINERIREVNILKELING